MRGRRTQLWTAVSACLATVLAVLVWTTTIASSAQPSRCERFAAQSRDRVEHPTGTGRRVVVVGDSYSLGSHLARKQRGWVAELPGRVQVFGFGGSGFSLRASRCGRDVAFSRRTPAALRTSPDLVVVEGGLNDFNQSATSIRAGYRRVIALVGTRPVVVVGPAAAPSRAAGARRVDAVLRAEARRSGTPYVSMLRHDFDYLDDRLHLTAAGHRAFGRAVAAALVARGL